jgi:LacI family transcriptional regulator
MRDVTQTLKGRRRPTIRAVADLAGVSQTTVSFVINDKPGAAISEATRRRVWQAVEDLDYRPNHAARSLSTRRSNLIGFISDRISSGAYGGQSVVGAQSVAWEQGRLLLIVDTEADEAIQRTAVEHLLSRQVEGMLIGASSLRAWRPPAMLEDVPTVLINCYDPDERFPCVIPDEFGGGYSATMHLIKAGHRRVALLYGTPEVEAGIRRRNGYLAALRDAGLAHDPALEIVTSWYPEGGRQGAGALLDRAEPPTALFCVSDWIAMGALQEVCRRGLAIPGDVAVVGYEDQEFAARLQPALTTLALPHGQIGKRAAELLVSRRGDRPLPAEVIEIPCPLVLRESA